jgi:hypothetical protein
MGLSGQERPAFVEAALLAQGARLEAEDWPI